MEDKEQIALEKQVETGRKYTFEEFVTPYRLEDETKEEYDIRRKSYKAQLKDRKRGVFWFVSKTNSVQKGKTYIKPKEENETV